MKEAEKDWLSRLTEKRFLFSCVTRSAPQIAKRDCGFGGRKVGQMAVFVVPNFLGAMVCLPYQCSKTSFYLNRC